MQLTRIIPLFLILFLLSSPAQAKTRKWEGRLITPDEMTESVPWVDAETKSDVSVRKLRATDDASFQLIRLNTAEKPHIHERHDLTVFVLRGEVLMHLGQNAIKTRPGDIIDIPRGTPHWAENRAKNGSEAYAIFTPAFNGDDTTYLYLGAAE